MKEQFEKFLKKHRAIRKFKANLKERGKDYDNHIQNRLEFPENYIISGFVWDLTKERGKYWNDLNNKWQEQLGLFDE